LRADHGAILEPDRATGLTLVRMPPGNTTLSLTLARTGPETLGLAISLAGALIWMAGLAWLAACRAGFRGRTARAVP
jgi:hypothetical protein